MVAADRIDLPSVRALVDDLIHSGEHYVANVIARLANELEETRKQLAVWTPPF